MPKYSINYHKEIIRDIALKDNNAQLPTNYPNKY